MLHYVSSNKGLFHCFGLYVSRTPKKRTKEEPRVTQIGPLQIHGNIELEYDALVLLTDRTIRNCYCVDNDIYCSFIRARVYLQ